jgi:hypothetical protein
VKSSSSIEDPQHLTWHRKNEMQDQLAAMGFSPDVALFALKHTRYTDLDEAINFLCEKDPRTR